MNPLEQVDVLINRYPELENQKQNIIEAYYILERSYSAGGKLLIAGNGGVRSGCRTYCRRINEGI